MGSSNPVKKVVNTVTEPIKKIGSTVGDALTPGKDILNPINKVVNPIVDTAKDLISQPLKGIVDVVRLPIDAISGGIESVADTVGLGKSFDKAKDYTNDLVDKGKNIIPDIGESLKPKTPDIPEYPKFEYATPTPGATETKSLARALRKRLASMRYGVGSTLLTKPMPTLGQSSGQPGTKLGA